MVDDIAIDPVTTYAIIIAEVEPVILHVMVFNRLRLWESLKSHLLPYLGTGNFNNLFVKLFFT